MANQDRLYMIVLLRWGSRTRFSSDAAQATFWFKESQAVGIQLLKVLHGGRAFSSYSLFIIDCFTMHIFWCVDRSESDIRFMEINVLRIGVNSNEILGEITKT